MVVTHSYTADNVSTYNISNAERMVQKTDFKNFSSNLSCHRHSKHFTSFIGSVSYAGRILAQHNRLD